MVLVEREEESQQMLLGDGVNDAPALSGAKVHQDILLKSEWTF